MIVTLNTSGSWQPILTGQTKLDAKLNSVSRFVNELRILSTINVSQIIKHLHHGAFSSPLISSIDLTAQPTSCGPSWAHQTELTGCQALKAASTMARLDRYLCLARVRLRNALLAATQWPELWFILVLSRLHRLTFMRRALRLSPRNRGCTLYWQTLVEPVEIEVFIKASMEGCLVQIGQVIEQS